MPTTHANPTPFLPLPRDDFQWKCISKQEQHNNYGWFTTWLWGRSLTPLPPRVAFVWCGEEWSDELRRQCARAKIEDVQSWRDSLCQFFCIFKRSLSLTWKGINQNITQNYSILLASTSGVHYYFLETGAACIAVVLGDREQHGIGWGRDVILSLSWLNGRRWGLGAHKGKRERKRGVDDRLSMIVMCCRLHLHNLFILLK